tara:strand:- start:12642 stop:13199 length:558 start_codon:yes stop_codon:yes gene_type:complete
LSSKSTFSNSASNSYATALYEIAKENSALDKIENDIKSLKKIVFENSNFKEVISSPTITKDEKKNIMFAIADKSNFDLLLKKFLAFVASKNRLFYLNKIIDSFLNLVSINKGELKAQLISSKELSIDEQKKIQNELSENFKHPLNISYKHDPSLIAGLIIQVGSVMVDTSIKTKLKKLEKNMVEA